MQVVCSTRQTRIYFHCTAAATSLPNLIAMETSLPWMAGHRQVVLELATFTHSQLTTLEDMATK